MVAPHLKDLMKIVPDTSVIVDGRIARKVKQGDFKGGKVIVPEAVVAELESQANKGRETGQKGIDELKRLEKLADNGYIALEYKGRRPDLEEIKLADTGEIDSIIREIAVKENATFVTSDRVQSEVARAKGLDVIYLRPEKPDYSSLKLEEYFDDKTMMVHLKQGAKPRAKRGDIGDMEFKTIRNKTLNRGELEEIAQEIAEAAKRTDKGMVEVERDGATVVQLREMRIAIARPPFSEGIEITAVKPIAKVGIDEYRLSEELKNRLLEERGVLIAGSPGAGKTTFAQAVAEFLDQEGFSVKTMEEPRDLQVDENVTQYKELEGSMEKTADVLLLVRPDYTVYDEMRESNDFEVYSDMRLAGVGMIGVVHATRAVDAVQRLVGRVELGMIPQIVDTVVFIEEGKIEKVYEIKLNVKVPEGMLDEDLARPVVEISDFETGEPEYEIYSYNRQVVVTPVDEYRKEKKEIEKDLKREIKNVANGNIETEIRGNKAMVWVDEKDAPKVIGKNGETIDEIERKVGINIEVRSRGEEKVRVKQTSRHVVLEIGDMEGEAVEVNADGNHIFTATVGRNGEIKVSRGSEIADELENLVEKGKTITAQPV